MYKMLPHPPYHIGWVVHEREDLYTKKGTLRKRPKKRYYASIFKPDGMGGDTRMFSSYDACDKFAEEVYKGKRPLYSY